MNSLIAFAMICILAGGWMWHRSSRVFSAPLFSHPFATAVGEEFSPAISPDGRQIAYVWDGDRGNYDIYLAAVSGGQPQRLTSALQPELYPAFSPDGSRLAYLRVESDRVDVIVRNLASGQERTVTQIHREIGRWAENLSPLLGNPGPAWSRDGHSLIVTDVSPRASSTNGLYRISLETGLRQQFTRAPGEARDFCPGVSPDGRQLAFVRYYTHGVGELFTMPLSESQDSPRPKQVTHDSKLINGIAWLADNQTIVFASNRVASALQLWKISLPDARLTFVPLNSSTATEPAVSSNGRFLAYVDSTENWNIWKETIRNHQILSPSRLLASSGVNKAPAYSPDGQQIAFLSDRSGSMEVWLAKADGSAPFKLTHFAGGYLGGVAWSPDGQRLAVDARMSGVSRIYVVSVHDGKQVLVEQNRDEERSPCWLSDSAGLLYNSNRSGDVQVWARQLSTGAMTHIADAPMFAAHTFPDGKALVLSDITGKLYTAALDGTGLTPLPGYPQASPVSSWSMCSQGLF